MRIALLALAVLAAAAPSSAQSARDSVLALDSLWARAYAVHDTAGAIRLFAPDLVMTTSSGGTKDREAELRDIRPADGLRMEFFRTRDVRLVEREGAVVVTGTAEWAFTMADQRREVRRRYTAVYARGGPLGWQMIGLHMGAPPPQ